MTKALATIVAIAIYAVVAFVVVDTWRQSRETNRWIDQINQHILERLE